MALAFSADAEPEIDGVKDIHVMTSNSTSCSGHAQDTLHHITQSECFFLLQVGNDYYYSNDQAQELLNWPSNAEYKADIWNITVWRHAATKLSRHNIFCLTLPPIHHVHPHNVLVFI